MSNQNEDIVTSLIAGTEFGDSRLYDILQLLAKDLYSLDRQINPVTTRSFGATGSIITPSVVTGFDGILYGNNLRLTWNASSGASAYRIRYGTDWETANELIITPGVSADIDPVVVPLIIGTHTFLIRSINSLGIESITHASFTLNIFQMTAPVISPVVIDNNVLLYWTAPTTTLNIDRYNVYKNGILIGTMKGTFEAIFETVAGIFEYGVEAVDIVGNVGLRSTVLVSVNQPPDYELQDNRVSDLLGIRVNTLREMRVVPVLITPVRSCGA